MVCQFCQVLQLPPHFLSQVFPLIKSLASLSQRIQTNTVNKAKNKSFQRTFSSITTSIPYKYPINYTKEKLEFPLFGWRNGLSDLANINYFIFFFQWLLHFLVFHVQHLGVGGTEFAFSSDYYFPIMNSKSTYNLLIRHHVNTLHIFDFLFNPHSNSRRLVLPLLRMWGKIFQKLSNLLKITHWPSRGPRTNPWL